MHTRNVAQYDRVGADLRVITNDDRAEELRAGADICVSADAWGAARVDSPDGHLLEQLLALARPVRHRLQSHSLPVNGLPSFDIAPPNLRSRVRSPPENTAGPRFVGPWATLGYGIRGLRARQSPATLAPPNQKRRAQYAKFTNHNRAALCERQLRARLDHFRFRLCS